MDRERPVRPADWRRRCCRQWRSHGERSSNYRRKYAGTQTNWRSGLRRHSSPSRDNSNTSYRSWIEYRRGTTHRTRRGGSNFAAAYSNRGRRVRQACCPRFVSGCDAGISRDPRSSPCTHDDAHCLPLCGRACNADRCQRFDRQRCPSWHPRERWSVSGGVG
jgi:hypothetical protein